MAGWQELCELLMDKALTPQEIVEKLGVKPYRLRQMLESKRLAERLGLVEQIAARRADHAILSAVSDAAEKLAALAAKDTETGRKACLDVLAQARVVRTDRDSAGKQHRLANWHKDYRKWERSQKRKAQRQGAAAVTNTAPDGAVPPDSRPAEPVAPARDTPPQAVPPPGRQAVPPVRRSKRKQRELAGLPPEEESAAAPLPDKLPAYLPANGGDGGFIPRPGGTIVRHIIGGKVFLGST